MLISGFFDGIYMGQDENGAIYDRNYQAEFFARYFSSFVSNGVFNKNVDSFKVVPLDGLNIVVKSGSCFINGYFGFEKEHNELILDENINSNSRIDRIILRLDLSSRDITIQVLKGEEAEEPTPKELNRSGDIYEIALADITISSNLENITNENIKDLRENNDLCGYVNHNLEEVDQNIFYNQIFKYLRKSRIKEKDEFKKWFEDVKSVLNTNTVSKHIVKSVFSESGVHNFRYNINTNKFEKFNNDTQEFEKIKLGADTTLKKTPKIIIKGFKKRITISWKDSEDITVKGEIVRRWKGTILVKKIGSPPLSYDDGEILVNNTERNKYLNAPFVDENIESNTEYFYGVFPYDDEGNYNVNIQNIVHGRENLLEDRIYSFTLNTQISDPKNNIQYLDDSEEYTDPESWDNSPLFQNIKPCLLKDGKVQYYLNVDNYDLKENGEPSNLNGIDGDVMVEFPPLVYRIEKLSENLFKFSIRVNNNDLDINDWTKLHLDYENGTKFGEKFYVSAYLCDLSDGQKVRSRATNTLNYEDINKTITDIFRMLKSKNNTSFIAPIYFQKLLILLCWLRFKTTDINSVLNLETFANLQLPQEKKYTIGSLKTGGLFSGCGSETPQEAVKICGIEFFCNSYKSTGTKYTFTPVGSYSLSTRPAWTHYLKYSYNNVYNNNSDGMATPHVKEYTIHANYYLTWTFFNDFYCDNIIGFHPYYNTSKSPNSTKDTYMCLGSFFGRTSAGDTLFLWDINAKKDQYGFMLFGNSGDHITSLKYSIYYMYIPPNEE